MPIPKRLSLVYPAGSIHRHPELADRFIALRDALAKHFDVDSIGRDDFNADVANAHDLVLVIGGDGTTLAAAQYVKHTPVLSLRLSEESVGYLCNADASAFEYVVDKLVSGRYSVVERTRIQTFVDGQPVGRPAYNDVLIANASPARATRYALHGWNRNENHCSSGIWFATAVGSHAAARAAGAVPLGDDDPRFLMRVREFAFADVDKPTLEATFLPGDSPEFTVPAHTCCFGDGDLWHFKATQTVRLHFEAAPPLRVVKLLP